MKIILNRIIYILNINAIIQRINTVNTLFQPIFYRFLIMLLW